MITYALEPAQVPQHLRADYGGRKFRAVVTETVKIPATAGRWDGGSKEDYAFVRLSTGEQAGVHRWSCETFIRLPQGVACVRRSIFCGKDLGLTFYVNPADVAKLLPPIAHVTDEERLVLIATRDFKPSYGGKSRYEMARDELIARHGGRVMFPSSVVWNGIKDRLISRGLLNKAGAITPAGRNAIANERGL